MTKLACLGISLNALECLAECFLALGEGAFSEEPSQTWCQNRFEIIPKLFQNCAKMVAKWALEASWRLLGASKKAWSAQGGLPGAYGSLLNCSWRLLGPKKSALEWLLVCPRRIPRQVSATWGAKRLPKWRPRGSRIESKRQLALKKRFLRKALFP